MTGLTIADFDYGAMISSDGNAIIHNLHLVVVISCVRPDLMYSCVRPDLMYFLLEAFLRFSKEIVSYSTDSPGPR